MKTDEEKKINEYIYTRIKNKVFWKDAKNWFYRQYVSSYKVKLDLIILLVFTALIILIFALSSIIGVLSVSAKNGVVHLESEFGDEFVMEKIPKYYRSNEKNILRFIIESYVNFFESYSVDKFNIYKLNDKIAVINGKSGKQVLEKFEKILRESYTNEVFSGLTRSSKVVKVEFVYNDDTALNKIFRYIFPEKTPNKVIINVISSVFKDEGRSLIKEEQRTIEIIFTYSPLERNKDGNFNDINFKVISYNYL
jgi:hypothetical protein